MAPTKDGSAIKGKKKQVRCVIRDVSVRRLLRRVLRLSVASWSCGGEYDDVPEQVTGQTERAMFSGLITRLTIALSL